MQQSIYFLFSLAILIACQTDKQRDNTIATHPVITKNIKNHDTGIKEPDIKRIDGSIIEADQLDQKIQTLIQETNVTGLALAILNDNQVVYQKAFGYANHETKEPLDVNHVFYGASLSKSVFGYLVARMVTEGIIDLDVPVNSYFNVDLPDIPIDKKFRRLHDLRNDDRYKQITTRMCLSHSTGFPNWRWINNPDEKLRIQFDPGTRYSYSGEGIMLAQWVVEQVTGLTLEEIAREEIFTPLQMDHTDYLWRTEFEEHFCYGHTTTQEKIPKDIETEDAAAAGSMQTTLVDYARFMEQILTLYSDSSDIMKTLFHPNIRIHSKAQFGPLAQEDTDEYDDIQLSYGLGWGLLQSDYGMGAFKEGHSEGFQHYSILFPDQKTGVLILSNSDNAESIFKELLEVTIGDRYTPWQWENYIPYNQ